MTWVKLDDGFPTHPKVIGLSDKAFRAHVVGLCYCSAYLTDGHLPPSITTQRVAAELIAAMLWSEDPAGGWIIHDYLTYNYSRAGVLAQREAKREAGRRGGRSTAQAKRQASAAAGATPSGSEVPNPHTHTNTVIEGLRPSTPSGAIVVTTQQQAMFGAVCEAMGYGTAGLGKDDQREIGGIAAALVDKGLHAEEVLPYVEWLVGPESPIVGGRRLTLHSVPKWVKDWRAAPRVVNGSNGHSTADRLANIQRNLAAMEARGTA